MTRAGLAFGFLCICASVAARQALPQVIERQTWPGSICTETWILESSSFNDESLRDLFLSAIKRESSDHPLIKIDVFVDREAELSRHLFGTDRTYSHWRRAFDSYKTRVPASAQLVYAAGNASMKVRDSSGAVRSSTLLGTDPTVVDIDGCRFFLADFIPRTLTYSRDIKPELHATFYFWSPDHYREDQVRKALDWALRTTPTRQAIIIVEPSPWFIVQALFPTLYPYQEIGEPPTEREYYNGVRISCGAHVGSLPVCWSYGGAGAIRGK